MRQYRPEDKVISALKELKKLVLSANNDMIRRKDPIKDFNEVKNTRKRNTIHIEGFPKDLSQDDVENWVNEKLLFNYLKKKKFVLFVELRVEQRKNSLVLLILNLKLKKMPNSF